MHRGAGLRSHSPASWLRDHYRSAHPQEACLSRSFARRKRHASEGCSLHAADTRLRLRQSELHVKPRPDHLNRSSTQYSHVRSRTLNGLSASPSSPIATAAIRLWRVVMLEVLRLSLIKLAMLRHTKCDPTN